MAEVVPPADIEAIVGVPRHPSEHWGRAVSAEQTVYVMHSRWCKATVADLRDCPFSVALDKGIDLGDWAGREDEPVQLAIVHGRLVPGPVTP